jgi:MIP family channel proteins
MGVKSLEWDDLRAAFAELIGTALFVFIGCGAYSASQKTAVFKSVTGVSLPLGYVLIAFAWGFSLAAVNWSIRGVRDAGHINPAVTFALIITKNITLLKGILFGLAQVVGAIGGAAILRGCTGADGFAGAAVLGEGVSEGEAFAMETILTFFWVFVFFCTSVHPWANLMDGQNAGKLINSPLALGFTVFVCSVVGIPYSGAGMNPARVLGVAIIDKTWDSDHHWLYWYGPLIGATIATLVYYIIYGHWEGGMNPRIEEENEHDGHGHAHHHHNNLNSNTKHDVEMAHQH